MGFRIESRYIKVLNQGHDHRRLIPCHHVNGWIIGLWLRLIKFIAIATWEFVGIIDQNCEVDGMCRTGVLYLKL